MTDLAIPPSGMMDAAMKPTGSDVEVAQLLAKDWGPGARIHPDHRRNPHPQCEYRQGRHHHLDAVCRT